MTTLNSVMRKLYLFGAILLSSTLSNCAVDTPTNTVGDGVVTTIEVELPETRIALGDKVNGSYSAFWSEGDKIVINGILTKEVKIDSENRSNATFEVEGILDYPFLATYPYTSATTAENPAVEFKSVQTYTPGTFCEGSAPLCGYATKTGDKIALKHLAGVLRFPVVATKEGVVLEKIVNSTTPTTAPAGSSLNMR